MINKLTHQLPKKGKKHSIPFILSLSNELLLAITDNLPIDTRACLALTCKELLTVLAPTLKHIELRYPSLWANHEFTSMGYTSTRTNARNRLLLHLQDQHWAYCSMCLKLHPAREFTKLALLRSPKRRVCMDPGLGGVVQLCPCMQLTVRGKAELMKNVLSCRRFAHFPPARAVVGSDGMPALGKWGVRQDETGRGMLIHSCKVERRRDWVEIILRPVLKRGELNIVTEYVFRLRDDDNEQPQQSTQQQEWKHPFLNCPHTHNIPDPGYSGYSSQGQTIMHCPRCETVFVKCIPAPSGRWRKMFTYRNLGGFKETVTWRQQCEGALERWNRKLWKVETD